MHRLSRIVIAVLLMAPAAAVAQTTRSPIPDHWLTLETLTSQLSLSSDQAASLSEPYAALNAALQQAYNRREELAATYSGTRGIRQMNDAQRQALRDQLTAISNEYAGRQREVDNLLASIRAVLTADQQAQFDGLEKPRVLPVTAPAQPHPTAP